MASRALTKPLLSALFNILTHAETYSEIEAFKHSHAIANYGYPFVACDRDDEDGEDDKGGLLPVTSPLLQILLVRFVLPLPGIRDLSPDFWSVLVQGLLTKLADAELSESYDKGAIGTRKTLATGSSAVIEALARGCLGGYSPPSTAQSSSVNGVGGHEKERWKTNGVGKKKDLEAAWDEFLRGLIHGDMIDELCDWLKETDDLNAHSPLVESAVEYSIIHLASLLHHVFAVTSEGQYVLKLVQNCHKLIPYAMIRPILKVGNAATMLHSLMKLLLAKLSLGSLSNWTGLTQKADEGMNLLQRIISGVLHWDAADFKKTCDKITKAKHAPSAKHLSALRDHIGAPKDTRRRVREDSLANSKSIVRAILDDAGDPKVSAATLTDEQHELCLQYYAAILAARDREEIVAILCKQNPDLLTQAVREVVHVYEPIIRDVHTNIDLAEHLDAARAFIDDFLAVSASRKVEDCGGAKEDGTGEVYKLPTVEDYVGLLHRHKGSVNRWLHHVCSKAPAVRDAFVDWAKDAAKAFRPEEAPGKVRDTDLLSRLQDMFSSLPEGAEKEAVRDVLEKHASYLASVEEQSRQRVKTLHETSTSNTSTGPGVYLSSWQSLLDEALITANAQGKLRRGRDVVNKTTPGKPGMNGEMTYSGDVDKRDAMGEIEEEEALRPDGKLVLEVLGGKFLGILREVASKVSNGQ